MRIVRKSQLETAAWKGGTTTQLFIHPAKATYQEFNFDFRMSYATVEIPESTFTFMPGVTRHLMILKGELDIDHANQYKRNLKKFDQDVFNGEWPTTARGKVTDFNLMVRNGYEGKLETRILQPGETTTLNLENPTESTGVFVWSGHISFVYSGGEEILNEGDFVFFEHNTSVRLPLTPSAFSELVIATVKKPS